MVKMLKMCYPRLKSSKKLQTCVDHPLLAYIFVKKLHKKGHGCCAFSFTITIIMEIQENLSTSL